MSIEQNATDQWLEFLVLNAGEPVTGLDQAEFTITYSVNNGSAGSYSLSDGSLNDSHAEGLIVELGAGKYHLGLKDAVLTSVGLVAHSIVCATSGNTAIPNTIRVVDPDVFKATGFSTHSASDVWSAGTRTLTGFGTLVSDIVSAVWSATTRTLSEFGFSVTASNMRGTDGAYTGTPPTTEEIDTKLTSEHGSGNWITGSSGSGGGSVTIAPIVGVVNNRTDSTNLKLYYGELRDNEIIVVDSNKDPVNLAGKTLQVCIESSGKDIQVDDSPIVSGTDSNIITFRNNLAVTSKVRELDWSLRDLTNSPDLEEVIIEGVISVVSAARKDA